MAISGCLLLAGLAVSLLMLALMGRTGQSSRPEVFFLGFFLIVVLSQFIYHLTQARSPGAVAPAAGD